MIPFNVCIWESFESGKCKVAFVYNKFRVIATFEQEYHSHSNDCNAIMASLENVGWIEEILELDYGRFQTVVLFCNWVVANYEGSSAIVKHNYYKFTLVNFERLIPLST